MFLSLWHCLDVHIYWDFSLGQAMTEVHKTGQGKQKQREEIEKARGGRKRKEHIIRSHANSTENLNSKVQKMLKKETAT